MIGPKGNPSDDIREILTRWPWSGDGPRARLLVGADGVERLQVRLEAGLLQFEGVGRPDGERPDGFESALDSARARGGRVGPDATEAMRQEAQLFHQRASAWFLLGAFDRASADCARNAAAMQWLIENAQPEIDPVPLQSIRFAAILLQARAEATGCARRGDTQGALAAIDRALAMMQRVQQEHDAVSTEVAMLRTLRDAFVPKLPSSQRADLEQRLRDAVRCENFALASILRDELRQISE
jgi:hypothetical protein